MGVPPMRFACAWKWLGIHFPDKFQSAAVQASSKDHGRDAHGTMDRCPQLSTLCLPRHTRLWYSHQQDLDIGDFSMQTMITEVEEQCAFFAANGYLVVRDFLPPAELAELRARIS